VSERVVVQEFIHETAMRLDAVNFKGYMALCDQNFRYTITAYSPEIRKDMIWLDHDYTGMETLFNNLPRHNSDHSTLFRHVTVYRISIDEAAKQAEAVSGLQVFRTELDGGTTTLYAVGKMYDTVNLAGDEPRLLARRIELETRNLGMGHHLPF
jgi:methanesulfonate monooxygenase subunit beta